MIVLEIAGIALAGLIALATRWWLEGGIRKRERATILEELELAEAAAPDQAEQLRDRARARLGAYLRPPWWQRMTKVRSRLAGLGTVVLGITGMAGFLVESYTSSTNDSAEAQLLQIVAIVAIAAGVVGMLTAVEQYLRAARIEREVDAQRKAHIATLEQIREAAAKAQAQVEVMRDRGRQLRDDAGRPPGASPPSV